MVQTVGNTLLKLLAVALTVGGISSTLAWYTNMGKVYINGPAFFVLLLIYLLATSVLFRFVLFRGNQMSWKNILINYFAIIGINSLFITIASAFMVTD